MNKQNKAINREDWLSRLAGRMAPLFTEAGFDGLTRPYKVTCGFPCRAATARKKRVVGQCHYPSMSEGQTTEIFISPVLADNDEVSGTLAHELAHAAVGPGHGHRGDFIRCCNIVGLNNGKPTNVEPGDKLAREIRRMIVGLGRYPHERLNVTAPAKKQGTRMIKVVCPNCGCTLRMTAKWLAIGLPTCACGLEMEQQL